MQADPILERRKQQITALLKIFRSIRSRRETNLFSFSALSKEYGIVVSRLDLASAADTTAVARGEKQFFQPIPPSTFANIPQPIYEHFPFEGKPRDLEDAMTLYMRLTNYLQFELSDDPHGKYDLLKYSQWEFVDPPCHVRTGGCERLWLPPNEIRWRPGRALDTRSRKHSHMITFLFTGILPDAHREGGADCSRALARSEIELMIDVIMNRMDRKPSFYHSTHPVLLVSIFNRQVRLIQGYFDGQRLHLQVSDFIDFETFDQSKLDLLLRWILSTPVGDTQTLLNSEPTKVRLDSSSVKSRQRASVAGRT